MLVVDSEPPLPRENRLNAVVTDITMQGTDGEQPLRAVRERDLDPPGRHFPSVKWDSDAPVRT
ncbi:hypothetical protein [Rhizobacter sp. Root1221]|uniref:hypothetical protein n=1 Tax=Rhizobacter sp. Root1221 TaxID=1736433 RepID=UPI000B28BDEC|nr:hypothetical protein [Rhizobacter sp. Root1221]